MKRLTISLSILVFHPFAEIVHRQMRHICTIGDIIADEVPDNFKPRRLCRRDACWCMSVKIVTMVRWKPVSGAHGLEASETGP